MWPSTPAPSPSTVADPSRPHRHDDLGLARSCQGRASEKWRQHHARRRRRLTTQDPPHGAALGCQRETRRTSPAHPLSMDSARANRGDIVGLYISDGTWNGFELSVTGAIVYFNVPSATPRPIPWGISGLIHLTLVTTQRTYC
jgi:hypothetical protein